MRRLLMLISVAAVAEAEVPWKTATPEETGMSSKRLDALQQRLAAHGTRAFLVVHKGRLVYEWYTDGVTRDTKQGTASMAKAIVGGTSLLLALQDGRLKIDDAAAKYIPMWAGDPKRDRITIRHLATHTSGIEDANQVGIAHEDLPGWMGEFWRRSPSPFDLALAVSPVLFEPGTRFHYSNPGIAALSYVVSSSIRASAQPDLKALLRDRVMRPLAIPDSDWGIGYNQVFERDGLKLYANWGGGSYTPRATARVGQWMLQQGAWEGRRIASADWVKRVTAYAGLPHDDRNNDAFSPGAALPWWTNSDGVMKNLPKDAYWGSGAGHQVVLVVPSLELVVVRNGAALSNRPYWTSLYEELFAHIAACVETAAPYPPSKVIRSVTFAPKETIVRKAIDSDNWPMTWGDDDAIYTSYGDGVGFEPSVTQKLSLGFAKVIGGPANFTGENIRSTTGERKGDGARGLKSSGMLMVGGVLYMWVRNAGNSELWWSEDKATTWNIGFRWTESFGSPVFLNFGRNYAGARDAYVYTYSQDGGSAYESDDQIVLARAPKNRIREQSAYEFYAGPGRWTKDFGQRKGVFVFPGHCQRVDAVYHPGLKRVLLAVSYGHDGGWGIYESENPWGPWKTAFHTNEWDLGRTHGYRLPAKWIEGNRMSLVFSGMNARGQLHYDAFCVRGMTLNLVE